MDEKAIKNFIDSFLKMCDYIEQTDGISCSKCPVYNDCFHTGKHTGLHKLMRELGIERNEIKC